MSLINRIEISNFVCLFGPEAGDDEWSPQFRHNLLDLRSQSTAISMPNGMGKTSLADAVIAVLSRDRVLVTKTREKMSPASCGVYSHIRVELNVPSAGVNSDMLVSIGQEVPGEKWVFGICGHRGKAHSATFYYYKGRLEDCPVAKIDGHHITLMSNADFKQSRKNISGLRFGVPEHDWREAMSPHFPPHTLIQMANFQKNGGGDTASSIYNVKQKNNEKYHESFFYSVIAPELMSGAMSDEDDEGDEYYLESTFMKSGRAYIRAKNETARREKALERDKQTLHVLEGLSEKAKKALETDEETQKLFSKISKEAGAINELIKLRFTGIPFAEEFPDGKIGDLARGIVVVPQVGPVIQDCVLSKLLGKNTGHLNRDAMSSGVDSTQIMHPIEIIMDSSIQDQFGIDSKPGPVAKGYTLDQAIKLLCGHDSDIENLQSAFQWFGSTVDSNPYRRKSQSLAQEISLLRSKIEECKRKSEEASTRRGKLEETITRIDSFKDAWQSLNEMGCFTDEELANPLKTHEQVKVQFDEAQKAVHEHAQKEADIKKLQPSYQRIVDKFGNDAKPGDILRNNKVQLAESKQRLEKARTEILAAKEQQKEASITTDSTKKDLEEAKTQLKNLQDLASKAEKYVDLFGEESPDGLEQRVGKDKEDHLRRQAELRGEIKQTYSLVESLHSFRSQVGDVSPSEWLVMVDDQRCEYVSQLDKAKEEKEDLARRLKDLESEKVSATTVAAAALETLAADGLHCVALHDAIRDIPLAEERKLEVLSYFSALLFSPVFESQDDAAKAAYILHEQDMPIPVFLKSNLADFAMQGSLSSGADGLVFDHQAGVCTRTVECIIDPSLIEREKKEVHAKLNRLEAKIGELNDHLQEISPSSKLYRLAQQAEEAEKTSAEMNLDRLKEEQGGLERKTDTIERRASHDAIQLIRSMNEFIMQGGSERLESVKQQIDDLHHKYSWAKEKEQALNEEIEKLQKAQMACEKKIDDFTLSPDLTIDLSNAEKFLDADGPAFLASAQDVASELKAKLKVAEQRNLGEYLFKNAAEFLKTKDTKFEQIQAEIRALKEEEKRLLEKEKDYNENVDGLERNRNRLRTFESSLDFVIAELLEKYKHIRTIPEASNKDSGKDSELVTQAVRFMNDLGQSDDADVIAMEKLKNALRDMDIKGNADKARRSKKRYLELMNELLSSIDEVIARDALTRSMKTALEMNKKKPSEIIAIRERFSVDFERSKEVFEEAKEAEEKVRNQARDRLISFCDDARDNLRLLQDVLKKGDARLEVKAKVADIDTLASIVDSIMTVIESEEEHFQNSKDGTKGEEEKYKATLTDKIRDRIYRGIFADPMVRVIHPDIHSGRATSISPKMSGGQRTAVSLMVMSKLAEYSMRKESIRNASSYAGRRKAIAKGTSVLIIDGLFSNLSKPSLIKKSMASLKASRGNFQLIGLIHWPQYENNYEIFPTYIIGKEVADLSNSDGVSGFVYTEDGSTIIPPNKLGRVPGELDSAAFHVSH